MNDSPQILLNSVKTAVAKYGLSGLSTRNIGEISGINDALIYRYFRNKEQLLQKAYEQENGAIFDSILASLKQDEEIPFSFHDRARLACHRAWREMLSDPDRLVFVTSYYHSKFFRSASAFHQKQLLQLDDQLGKFFPSNKTCEQTMYALLVLLYDFAKRVVDGMSENTSETEEQVFSMFYAVLTSQMKNQQLKNQEG